MWNSAGIHFPPCDELDRVAQAEDPEAPSVWNGCDLLRCKASRCWAHLLAMTNPSRFTWPELPSPTKLCWIVFPCFRMCTPLGLSCCIA